MKTAGGAGAAGTPAEDASKPNLNPGITKETACAAAEPAKSVPAPAAKP